MDFTGIGSVADAARTIVNKFLPDKMGDGERAKAELQLQKLLSKRDTAVVESKKAVLVAELNQSDNYTKRARPTVVYAGLVFIFIVHVLFPIVAFCCGNDLPELTLPKEFWIAWGGICSVWVIGRSAEKRGVKNKVVNLITGSGGGL